MVTSKGPTGAVGQAALYEAAIATFGAPLERLARAYEPDPDRRRDLLQEIHVALWRSMEGFDGRCSMRTWVYRVAHNTATSLVSRRRARTPELVSLADLEAAEPASSDGETALDNRLALERLFALIQRLKPLDRQIILLYLEGVDGASIGEIAGLSQANVGTRVHRIKRLLARRFSSGVDHE